MAMSSPELKGWAPRAPRRVCSAPIAAPSRLGESPDNASSPLIDTLITVPDVKVVQFATSGQAVLEDIVAARQEAGSWPPWSRTERTIAMGTLSIYRRPGSVAFLNCGSALQPILPKSQCWCIDETSNTFVLQIRRPNYWRIELGVSRKGEEEKKSKQLKDVLGDILQFEKTYCPFERSFTIDVDEESLMPTKKIPWSPKAVLTPSHPPNAADERPATSDGLSAKQPSSEHGRPLTADAAGDGRNIHIASKLASDCTDLEGQPAPPEEVCQDQPPSAPEEPGSAEAAAPETSNEPSTTAEGVFWDRTVTEISTGPHLEPVAVLRQRFSKASPSTTFATSSGSQLRTNASGKPMQADNTTPMLSEHITAHAALQHPTQDTISVSETSLQVPATDVSNPSTESRGPETPSMLTPSMSRDSFYSVQSSRSSISSATGSIIDLPASLRTSPEPQDDTIDDTMTIAPIVRKRAPVSIITPRAQMSLLALTGELLLRPPAFLIALMVKIAAKISRRGWTENPPLFNYDPSDDETPVFYDFSDNELSD